MPKTKLQPHPKDKPHYKGLTVKQQGFVDEIVEQVVERGEINAKQAALVAYDTKPSVAGVIGHENLNKPYLREAYLLELERRGLSDDLASKTLKNAMLANKRVRDYETGKIKNEPDHPTRLRAAQEYHKVKGLYPDKKVQINRHTASVSLFASMTTKELRNEVRRVEASIKKLQQED